MLLTLGCRVESLATFVTGVLVFSRVRRQMILKTGFLLETFLTKFAMEHNSLMTSNVGLVMRLRVESLVALSAFVDELSSVQLHVMVEIAVGREYFVTQGALNRAGFFLWNALLLCLCERIKFLQKTLDYTDANQKRTKNLKQKEAKKRQSNCYSISTENCMPREHAERRKNFMITFTYKFQARLNICEAWSKSKNQKF